ETREAHARIAETVKTEEERFAETLDLGMAKIREYLDAHARERSRIVDGRFLFTLYDTHGFPADLAQEVFQDAGWSVTPDSLAAFEAEMDAQRERARAAASFGSAGAAEDGVAIYQELSTALPRPAFLGYTEMAAPGRILAIVADGRRRPQARARETVE